MGRTSLSQNTQLLWKLLSQQHEKQDHCQESHGQGQPVTEYTVTMETHILAIRNTLSLSGTTWVGPACHQIFSYYRNSNISNTKNRIETSYYGNAYLSNMKKGSLSGTTWIGPTCYRIYSYYGNSNLSNTKKQDHCQEPHG